MVSINGSPTRHGRRKAPLAARISINVVGVCFLCCFIAWFAVGLLLLRGPPIAVHESSALRGGQATNSKFHDELHDNTLDTTPSSAIAYVASVTGCGSDSLVDGAAVLKHSIHLSSIHGIGRYDYKMYAIVTPEAMSCAAPLANIGYTIIQRDTPVAVDDIQGEFLRGRIQSNGCCGEKELIKFEAYTLTQHPLVVHLDLDVLVLKPLDIVFDLMLGKGSPDKSAIMWKDQPLPDRIDAVFTRDYNMVPASRKYKPVQGGFLVLRPSMETYNEIVEIIKKGDFIEGKGWGGVMGLFYGSMTFQGLIPYYYDVIKPGFAVELNRCIYNNMCDNPRDKKTVNDVVDGNCRDGRDDCEDCRSQPLEDIVTTHFTLCQKPWLCIPQDQDQIQHRLCRKLHNEWFRVRSSLEESWGRVAFGPGQYQKEQFYGFCEKRSEKGYVRIDHPSLK